MRTNLRAVRGSSTQDLASVIALAVVLAAFPGYITFDHVRDRLILADRGVQVNAWVVDYNWVRKGRDTVVVRPDEPPYFEATLSRWPGDIAFNDRLDVVFDPDDPGRVVAVDEPLVDGHVLLVAGLDLVALFMLFAGLVAVRELLRRARARRPGDVVPKHDDPPGARSTSGSRFRTARGAVPRSRCGAVGTTRAIPSMSSTSRRTRTTPSWPDRTAETPRRGSMPPFSPCSRRHPL